AQAAPEDCAGRVHVFLPFRPGMGKQIFKNGSQKKIVFSTVTNTIRTMSAQIVIIGIENEQIVPPPTHGPVPPSPTGRSLWKGQGSTDITRSPKVTPWTRAS